MVRRTPNGFEQFTTWLYKAFWLFCTLAILYRVILYQNVLGIVIKSIQKFRIVPSLIHNFLDKSFEFMICQLSQRQQKYNRNL